MCDFYGPNAVSVRLAQNWLKRFHSGNFDVKDERRVGQLVTDKVDAILEKGEQYWHISCNNTAGELWIDHKTLLSHFKKAKYAKTFDTCVPHEPAERNLMNRVFIDDSVLKCNETAPFFQR
ncbi:Histone-lysine N-methyltransferase SETMAR [Eumeta japonica]|uniref:Histone-lysine N-methyltransferase SETMAR n=1 Tax=Eumeta variegata TaxID=151549 RepID=A0A4C1XPF2_EUMVA|nr:Histone-lysine N-methyltransferase SETMAR [Eumeta japonica]